MPLPPHRYPIWDPVLFLESSHPRQSPAGPSLLGQSPCKHAAFPALGQLLAERCKEVSVGKIQGGNSSHMRLRDIAHLWAKVKPDSAHVTLSCRERWAGQTVLGPPGLAESVRDHWKTSQSQDGVVCGNSVSLPESRKLLLPGRLSLVIGGSC